MLWETIVWTAMNVTVSLILIVLAALIAAALHDLMS